MKKDLVIAFVTISLFGIIFSCTAQKDDENVIPIKIVSEKYEPCCGSENETNLKLEGIDVFIPNVFTPNEDGINDLWYPIFNAENEKQPYVLNFAIFNSNDPSKRRIIFSVDLLVLSDLKSYAFSGIDYQQNFGQKIEGQFWYEFEFHANNTTHYIKGSACSIVCDEEAPIFKDKEGCFFPAQLSKDFIGDNKLPNLETDCFK